MFQFRLKGALKKSMYVSGVSQRKFECVSKKDFRLFQESLYGSSKHVLGVLF